MSYVSLQDIVLILLFIVGPFLFLLLSLSITNKCKIVYKALLNSDLLDKGYHMYMDNYYSSPELFEHLRDRDTFATGTCRISRKQMPKAFQKKSIPKVDVQW